jgi:3-oxoacyl-[acyl-carrier protein] reductase
MDLGLNGKVALVTGAGSQKGFGKAISLTLAKDGCDIIVNDIAIEGAEKTAAEVKALGREVIALRADVTKSTEVNDMVKAALEKFGKIDILVNNVGASTPPKPFVEKTEADWDFDMSVNLKGALNCTKAVLSHMISRKSGKIINISAGAGRIGGDNVTTYAAAKAGVIAFTRGLAREVIRSGVYVNGVAPGLSDTGFASDASPEILKELAAATPLGALTVPQDIANMVAFLASDVSNNVGQTFSVDGGWCMI